LSKGPTAYEGIAAEVRRRIETGHYPPGSVLPSNRQLCAEFGVADGTIRRALAEVDRLGLTAGRQGRQRMVATPGEVAVRTEYERVAHGIRQAIGEGRLARGSALPSEADLAAQYGVGRKTVRQALAELERSGEIVNRPGRRRQVPGGQEAQGTLYEKVAAQIIDEVAIGRYPKFGSVPSEESLRTTYGVSRTTIRKALAELRRQGVVTYDRGRTGPSWGPVNE